jgi:acyl carrier protein
MAAVFAYILAPSDGTPHNCMTSRAEGQTRAPLAADVDLAPVIRELATLIAQAVNLEVEPEKIDPDAPLYKEGLGLDSIDILEIALVVAKRYNLQLKAESEENHVIFASLRNLARHVATHAAAGAAPRV